GIIGTIIPAIILVILGFSYLWFSGKPAVIPLGWGDLFPNIANFQNIVLAASIFLAYAGMEMNAVHVNDLDNPTKKYP
ncbi:amino acid transporter, partial [Escherichia coli]|nr:amino acid transporter [Escherichia coli]